MSLGYIDNFQELKSHINHCVFNNCIISEKTNCVTNVSDICTLTFWIKNTGVTTDFFDYIGLSNQNMLIKIIKNTHVYLILELYHCQKVIFSTIELHLENEWNYLAINFISNEIFLNNKLAYNDYEFFNMDCKYLTDGIRNLQFTCEIYDRDRGLCDELIFFTKELDIHEMNLVQNVFLTFLNVQYFNNSNSDLLKIISRRVEMFSDLVKFLQNNSRVDVCKIKSLIASIVNSHQYLCTGPDVNNTMFYFKQILDKSMNFIEYEFNEDRSRFVQIVGILKELFEYFVQYFDVERKFYDCSNVVFESFNKRLNDLTNS